MFAPWWKLGMDTTMLAFEAQQVIGLDDAVRDPERVMVGQGHHARAELDVPGQRPTMRIQPCRIQLLMTRRCCSMRLLPMMCRVSASLHLPSFPL